MRPKAGTKIELQRDLSDFVRFVRFSGLDLSTNNWSCECGGHTLVFTIPSLKKQSFLNFLNALYVLRVNFVLNIMPHHQLEIVLKVTTALLGSLLHIMRVISVLLAPG